MDEVSARTNTGRRCFQRMVLCNLWHFWNWCAGLQHTVQHCLSEAEIWLSFQARPGEPSGILTRIADRFVHRALSAGHLTATGLTAFAQIPLVNRQDLQEAHLWSNSLHASVSVLHSVRCPSRQPARQAAGQALRDAFVLFQIMEHYLLRENSTAAGTVGSIAASHPSTIKVGHTLQQHAVTRGGLLMMGFSSGPQQCL